MARRAKSLLERSARLHAEIAGDAAFPACLAGAANACIEALRSGGKILVAGNGGSAAAAQHFAEELVGRYARDRDALPALALGADTAVLTAVGNDLGYEQVFARQIQALGRRGDVFVALSTSGASRNVLAGLAAARRIGIATVGLTGAAPGAMDGLCDHLLRIPSRDTPLVQEGHLAAVHAIASLVEDALFPESAGEQCSSPASPHGRAGHEETTLAERTKGSPP